MIIVIRSQADEQTLKKVAQDLNGYIKVNEMDFDSMINLRPAQNTSREILDQKIRQQVELITRSLLKGK